MTIRVLLADDQALLAGTFHILIDATDGMEVVGVAEDGDQAVRLARTTAPDIVVMDIRMPGKDGLDAAEEILRAEAPNRPRILVLTTFETDEYVTRALRAGVSGFLGKGIAPAELLSAIRTVAAGDMILSPLATHTVISRYLAVPGPPTGVPQALETLTVPKQCPGVGLGPRSRNCAYPERCWMRWSPAFSLSPSGGVHRVHAP
ncbi:response regulator [Streptomyces sp. NRRL S-15]|uniref:response regulator n=1 Tax=Streptomyces sp. NRRL S-15 TaxID=1463886 RepID=UPI00099D2CBA|nr:response regulator transcription factor [Streptomyces sp. NRRL S-15]